MTLRPASLLAKRFRSKSRPINLIRSAKGLWGAEWIKTNLGQRRFQVIVLNLERRICMLHIQYSFTEYALICFTRFFLLIDIPSVYSVMISNCMYTLYSLIKVKLITGLLHVYHHCVLVQIQLASQENENIAVLYSSLILLFFSYIERNVNNGITVIFCYLNTC